MHSTICTQCRSSCSCMRCALATRLHSFCHNTWFVVLGINHSEPKCKIFQQLMSKESVWHARTRQTTCLRTHITLATNCAYTSLGMLSHRLCATTCVYAARLSCRSTSACSWLPLLTSKTSRFARSCRPSTRAPLPADVGSRVFSTVAFQLRHTVPYAVWTLLISCCITRTRM